MLHVLAMRDNRLRDGKLHRSIKEAESDLSAFDLENLIKRVYNSTGPISSLENEWTETCQNYQAAYAKFHETNVIEDVQLLEKADIIGMTTTGAAKNFKLLKMLAKCKVVLIEEAGQVLESHVVTALPPNCKQLILIGDHQQLRPTVSTYHMAKKYGLDISLFERFIKNMFPYSRLEEQHRMCPEIAKIMSTVFYKGLKNHPSVTKYPKNNIGLGTNLFFLTHNYLENGVSTDELYGKSKVNVHEAYLLLYLARYLLANGCKKEKITILTTYLGQFFELRKLLRETFSDLDKVSIAVVDNFQGEENDIILLSLVRSNYEGSIGFLSIQSRICVALSRARMGLYIVGNMSELASASTVWRSIQSVLIESNMIGESLQLFCKVHNRPTKRIKVPEDFERLVNRGCKELCNETLRCGHICELSCHVDDRLHREELGRCRMKCQKSCPDGHRCQKLCYQKCYPCEFQGDEITLGCGHVVLEPCPSSANTSVERGNYFCQEYVFQTLTCGHHTKVYCGDLSALSTIHCTSKCEYVLSCGHSCNLPCHYQQNKNSHNKKCMFPCNRKKLKCHRNHLLLIDK